MPRPSVSGGATRSQSGTRRKTSAVRAIRSLGLDEEDAGTPRHRLLETALELFYLEGARGVGVDRLIARAGVAKASFYFHFGSKNDLVSAYLEAHSRGWMAWLATWCPDGGDAETGLHGIFDGLRHLFGDPDFRGCAFANALADLGPVVPTVRAHARAHAIKLGGFIADLGARLQVPEPKAFAGQTLLVLDGAMASAARDRKADAAERARSMVETLIFAGRPV